MFKTIVDDRSFGRRTGLLRGLAAMLLVPAVLLLASSCAQEHDLANNRALPLVQDSQKDLVGSLQTIALSGGWDRYASAMDSEYRQPFGQMLSSARQYVEKLDTLADLVKERIGDKQAQTFGDKAKSIREKLTPSPAAGASGGDVIDWTRIQFLAEGVGYLVIVNQDETEFSKQFLLLQRGDKWWLTPRLTTIPAAQHKSKFSQYAKSNVRMFDRFSKSADDMIRDVRSGKLNKDNFEQNMQRPGEPAKR
jgi:hypothetical protein